MKYMIEYHFRRKENINYTMFIIFEVPNLVVLCFSWGKILFRFDMCVNTCFWQNLRAASADNCHLVISVFNQHSLPSFTIRLHNTQTANVQRTLCSRHEIVLLLLLLWFCQFACHDSTTQIEKLCKVPPFLIFFISKIMKVNFNIVMRNY